MYPKWRNVVSFENVTSNPQRNTAINIVIPPCSEILPQIIWIDRFKLDKAIVAIINFDNKIIH